MEHKDLTEKIIGCAYHVYNTMGSGFLESVYRNCLCISLRNAGFKVEAEVPIDVYFEGQPVGQFFADIIVDGLVILELKAIRMLVPAHEVQLVNYLQATGKPVGLLINFGEEKVEIRRKVRELAQQR